MSLKKRVTAVVTIVLVAAVVLYGAWVDAKRGTTMGGNTDLDWYEREETLYFWYSDDSMTNFINSAAVAFGEQEKIRVIPVLASESEYLEAINRETIHSNQVPDLYIASNDMLEKAYLAGLATPIDDVQGVCTEENFSEGAFRAVTYQDKVVAYPLFFETSALVYNKTYLEQWAGQAALREIVGAGDDENTADLDASQVDPGMLEQKTNELLKDAVPKTVFDIMNIANTFNVPEGVESVLRWDVSDIFHNYWIVGRYMNVGGENGDDPTIVNIGSAETIECLEVYKALNQFFFIESNKVTYESVVDDFCKGKIVFTFATSDVIQKLRAAKEEGGMWFAYDIASMPHVSDTLQSRAVSVTSGIVINGYSEQKELANRFAAYLVTECAQSLYERTGKLSANKNTNTEDAQISLFHEIYAGSLPLPKIMEAENFWMHLEAVFAKVWNGADVPTELQALTDQIQMQIDASMMNAPEEVIE